MSGERPVDPQAGGEETIEESPPDGHVLIRTIDALDPKTERYTLSRLHSKGGLGQVWLARDTTLDREVAFKEIRPERAEHPNVWARFVREAKITGGLEHPSIVPIYELSRRGDTGRPFYTMRFIRGRTLREAIAAYHAKRESGAAGSLDLQTLLNALVGVANAVAYAHAKGVIHRDLKPDNVVLGDYGEVILLDWGLAKAQGTPDEPPPERPPEPLSSGGGTVEGTVLGTPAYMAPEQAAGRTDEVGPKSDVYGLGAILYEILTSRPPVEGAGSLEVLLRAVQGPRPRPRTLRPDVPPALEAICMQAVAVAPDDRYPSAAAFSEDIRRFLADEPVSAWPEPRTRRAARWARRHRTLVTSAGILLAAAVFVLAAGTVLLGRKNREIEAQRAHAEENFRLAKDAVDRYLTQVGDSAELKAKGLEGLRTKLFDAARVFYEKFALIRAHDPAARADLAAAHLNLGNISRETGDTRQAEASLRTAIELYREPGSSAPRADRLAAVGNLALLLNEAGRSEEAERAFRQATALIEGAPDAEDEAFLTGAANVYDNLGTLESSLHQVQQSEAAHEKGRALRERLVALHPDSELYQGQLLISLSNLASLHATTGREADALPYLERATALGEKLVAAHPDNPTYATGLAVSYNNLGGVYTLTRRNADARQAHARALAIREKIAAEHPAVLDDQLYLAGSYVNLGELEVRDGQYEAALVPLERAERALGGILEKTPDHAVARFYTAYALSWRARALGGLERGPDAMKTWERATAFNDRGYPTIPAGYAVALARRGEAGRALAVAAGVEKIAELSGEVLYDLAAVYSLASAKDPVQREAHAAHAAELLTQAAARGLFKMPGMAEQAAQDHDLDPLRGRDDYRRAVE
ncbi:MAG TPA: serine/threonine-protein kinase [Candidatus Polarisedimenticolaceae bacterium]|nr:serine/threonine-protein kinase [Candidatus Polarisedimenticolaceae bacterium]